MAGIGGVVIQFTAKADQALRETKKLAKNLDKVGDESEGTGRRLSRMAKVGIAGVAGAAIGAGKALFDMGQMAAEDAKQADQLERVLGNVTDATNEQITAVGDWIDKMQLATHVADTELREGLGRLAAATGDVTEAQDLMSLAVDTATSRGESLDSVVRMLEKAVAGNTNTLKRQMPWLDANNDGTVTLKEAIDGLAGAYSGAAEAAAEKDPFEKLQIIWDETQETLGTALLPKLEELGTWLSSPEGQAAIEGWIAATGDFAENMSNLGDEIGPVIDLLKDITDAYNKLPDWMKTNPISGLANHWENRPWGDKRTNERAAPNRNDDPALSAGKVVNITVNNPSREVAERSIAAALRAERALG